MLFVLNKSVLLSCLLVIHVFIGYGCSSNVRVPVEQRIKNEEFYNNNKKGFNKNKITEFHVVIKGDSLYSIAWQYGLDYKELAKWNNIKYPYLIFAGKKLRIKQKKTVIKKNSIKKKKQKYRKKIKIAKNTKKKIKSQKTVIANKQSQNSDSKKFNWVWPAKGKLIQHFAPSKGKKGIDISLQNKTRIRATESGKVVYSGHGLTGYGLLIIIKHNYQYLSAYAHNSKLLVEEGSRVQRNQVIALAGKTASERVKLHFEIRKNGKPVNPLKYLPK
jgi:lipoprotein NlpD